MQKRTKKFEQDAELSSVADFDYGDGRDHTQSDLNGKSFSREERKENYRVK